MDGIFNVLKPPGMTSHDVVAFLRRALRTKKMGHGGTLDPDAAGVLPVFAGSATRLLEFAAAERKSYRVEITLGRQTDTGDDSGRVIRQAAVPALEERFLSAVLKKFTGRRLQKPPMYSAVKINGQKLYRLARSGMEVERPERAINIYRLEPVHVSAGRLLLDVECSKGTYIRVLAEEIAAALHTCGTVSFLLRTRVGVFALAEAHTLQEIASTPARCLLPSITALGALPRLALTARQAARISQGVRTTVAGTPEGRYALLGPQGEFLGTGTCSESMIQAEKILERYLLQEAE